jgi:hypothetical protein
MRRNEIPRKRRPSRLPSALTCLLRQIFWRTEALNPSIRGRLLYLASPSLCPSSVGCVRVAPPHDRKKKSCLFAPRNRRGISVNRVAFHRFDASDRCSQQINAGSGRLRQQPENGFWSSGRGRGRIGDSLEAQVSLQFVCDPTCSARGNIA